MARRNPLQSPGGAFLGGGLALWAVAWLADLSTHIERVALDPTSHTHLGGDFWVRVNLPITGLPFVAAGVGSMIGFDRLLKQPGMFGRFCAGMLFAIDGLAHAFAFNEHLNAPVSAAAFAIAAPLQIFVGVALPFLPRRYDRFWAVGAFGLLGAYIASRALSYPPLFWPEPVELLGLFSKALEVAFLLLVLPGVLRPPVDQPSAPRSGEVASNS